MTAPLKILGGEEMKVYVFPGQGAQAKGMGEGLFEEFPDLVAQADEILGYSIRDLCMEDKDNLLGQTQYTQPALFIVECLSYLKKMKDGDEKPAYVAGHSLGEYSALFAAGAFDFPTGLKLVKKRGELMAKVSGGGMAAVLGMTEEEVRNVLAKHGLSTIDLANINTPSQIAISGMKQDILDAEKYFMAEGAMNYVVLKVSGAFHSRYMVNAANEFEKYIKNFIFQDLKIPVISNTYARPYKRGMVSDTLVKQISNSVKWVDSVRYMMGKGIEDIEEVGPGRVLSGMVRQVKRKSTPLIVEDEVEEVQSALEKNVSESETSDAKNQSEIKMESCSRLGAKEFKDAYGVKYAYIACGMAKGIGSKELVEAMGKTGFLAFLGTDGVELSKVKDDICYIQEKLNHGESFGVNLLCQTYNPEKDQALIQLCMDLGVNCFEASGYMSITGALVMLRLHGAVRNSDGTVHIKNKIIAKVSRPEVAEKFLSSPPEWLVQKLLQQGKITREEAELASSISMADDLCVEADSAASTDQGTAYSIFPAIKTLRDTMQNQNICQNKIRVGLAGGIGSPEAVAASFVMGAEFIGTGSINQCTVEAGMSTVVKDMLQGINVQDTTYAPDGNMFEMGAMVQVLKRGVFFPARANKLYELYKRYDSIQEIPEVTKEQLQDKYFKKSFEQIYDELKTMVSESEIQKAEGNPKYKMVLIFKWYFAKSMQYALEGDMSNKVDFQVYCGSALGSFNQWVKGTSMENWQNRHVDEIAVKLMTEGEKLLQSNILN